LENGTDSLKSREIFITSTDTKECAKINGSSRQLPLNTFFDQQLIAPKGQKA
jgi:hypothetical protein